MPEITRVVTPAAPFNPNIAVGGGVTTYKGPGSTVAPPPTPTEKPPTFNLPNIAIVGDSGQGKSNSLRNMPWEHTAIIDTERKSFPFKTDGIKYYYECKSAGAVEQRIDALKANPGPIRYVVLDSLYMYMDLLITECKLTFKNYDIYNNYNDRLRALLNDKLKDPRLIFIVIAQPELVQVTDEQGKNTSKIRMYTFGKEHEGKLERQFLAVFHTNTTTKDAAGKIQYMFRTNTDGINSAKSPTDWFSDKPLIPNDLAAILKIADKDNYPAGTAAASK